MGSGISASCSTCLGTVAHHSPRPATFPSPRTAAHISPWPGCRAQPCSLHTEPTVQPNLPDLLNCRRDHRSLEIGKTLPSEWQVGGRLWLSIFAGVTFILSRRNTAQWFLSAASFLSTPLSQSCWKIWAKFHKSLVNVNLWFLYSKEVFKFRRRLFKQCCNDQTHGNSRL